MGQSAVKRLWRQKREFKGVAMQGTHPRLAKISPVSAAIFSDLHLGLASGRDLLRRPPVLDALLGAIGDVDEIVLLGDLVELRERPVAHVLSDAVPVLRRIGEVAAGKRITIVPGNHDHQLAAPLVEAVRMRDGGGALEIETFFDPPREGPLGAIADALGRDGVRLAYPGLWLRPDVYATHGHYLDVHNTVPTFERIAIGAVQRVGTALPDGRPLTPEDYEAAVGPVYALTYAMAQSARRGGRSVAGSQTSVRLWKLFNGSGARRLPALLFGSVALPAAIAGLNRAGLGPLKPDLSAIELREAGLRGMRTMIERLGIEADHVIFGHTHRSGPHERDEGWGPLMNTGSWILEPAFLGREPKESPYWPGHVALVPDQGAPELVTLLEDL
jgi:predicted phosphodiesterase